MSLLPLIRGEVSQLRDTVFASHTGDGTMSQTPMRMIRTSRYKYIHWIKFPDQDELYDLQRDSLERRNVARDPAMAEVRSRMREELARLVVQSIGLESR